MKRIHFVAAVMVLIFLVSSGTLPVRAHQPFDVGPYHIEIGWATEPPVTWQQNAIEVIVTNSSSQAGITNLLSNLTITLSYAGQNRVFNGQAGQIRTTDTNGTYRAPVVVTQPGSYNATLTGFIGHTSINLKAVPDGFERVQDGYDNSSHGVMFPGPARSPTQLQADIADANNRANASMTFAYVGIAIGTAGILLAAIALFRKPRTVAPR